MDQNSVNSLICRVRQTNGLLQLIDAHKNNPSITLGEIQQKFKDQYGISPADNDFAFYNQHQLLNSLSAYLCMPSEKFYNALPEIPITSLPSGWGTEGLFFSGSLKLKTLSLKALIRHLRNAVSHGHISICHELLFEFHNRNYTVVFNHVNLHHFCQALAYWCITKDVTLAKL